MAVILGGDLHYFRVAELLAMFAAQTHSGTFSASDGSRKTTVSFQEGKISWVDSNGGHLGAEEGVLDLLSWSRGTFEFFDQQSLPSGRQALDLDVRPLLSEAMRREGEREKILSFYPDDRVTFSVAEEPAQDGKISMTAEQFKLVFQIGRGRSLRELCEQLGRPPLELYPIIHELEANGWIIPVPAPAGGVPPTGAAKSQPQPAPAAPPTPPPSRESAEKPAAPAPPASQSAANAAPAAARPQAPAPSASPAPAPPKAPERPAPAASQRPAAGKTPAVPAASSLIGSLTVDGPSGAVYPLLEDECIVGRGPENSVAIPDGSISTKHARILRTPEGFVLEDLKSRNGTFVNGEQIKEKCPLKDKDVVRFGKVLLTFHLAEEMSVGEKTVFEPSR